MTWWRGSPSQQLWEAQWHTPGSRFKASNKVKYGSTFFCLLVSKGNPFSFPGGKIHSIEGVILSGGCGPVQSPDPDAPECPHLFSLLPFFMLVPVGQRVTDYWPRALEARWEHQHSFSLGPRYKDLPGPIWPAPWWRMAHVSLSFLAIWSPAVLGLVLGSHLQPALLQPWGTIHPFLSWYRTYQKSIHEPEIETRPLN